MNKFTDRQVAIIISSLSIRRRIELAVNNKDTLKELDVLEKIFSNFNYDFYYDIRESLIK